MKKALFLALLLAAPGLWAAKPKPTPAATLVVTPEAAPSYDDLIVLKDGQSAKGHIGGYDAYFLQFSLPNGAKIDLPMKEIAEIQPASFTGDMAMISQSLSREDVPVTAHIQPKDAGQALGKAFFPGFFIHGYGHKVAGDNEMFMALAGAELFGVLVGGFGAVRQIDPAASQQDKDFSAYLLGGGAVFFGLSWLVDIALASHSAKKFNEAHHLSLLPDPDGGRLAWSTRF